MARVDRAIAIASAPAGVGGDAQSFRQYKFGWRSRISLFQLREYLTSPLIEGGRIGRRGGVKLDLHSLPLLLEKGTRPRDVTVGEPRSDYGNALACSSRGVRFLPKGWKIVRQFPHLIPADAQPSRYVPQKVNTYQGRCNSQAHVEQDESNAEAAPVQPVAARSFQIPIQPLAAAAEFRSGDGLRGSAWLISEGG